MKLFAPMLFILIVLTGTISAQNLLNEQFDYAVRDSLDGIGGWASSKIIKSKIAIVSPGLSFPGYAANGIGNAIRFPNVDNGDVCSKLITKLDTGSVYMSYLIRVDSITAGATSGYNITLDQYGGATNHTLKAYVQRATDSTFYFGLSKVSGIVTLNKLFKKKQTYLVVLRYTWSPGASNDTVRMYIYSSSVPLTEPAKPDTFSSVGADVADLGEVLLPNSYGSSGMKSSPVVIDEIRIGTTWANTVQAPAESFMTEDFYYSPGDSLNGKNGWGLISVGSPLIIDSVGLTFSGHKGSGLGRSLKMTGGSNSQKLFRQFPWSEDSTIYTSVMVQFSGTNATQGYFLVLANSNGGNFRAIVFAKIISGKVYFGLMPTTEGAIVYDPNGYTPNLTYLLVLKYRIVAGSNNDQVSLFVIANSAPGLEPTQPSVGPLTMPNDAIEVMSVILSAGSGGLSGSTFIVDGLRVTKRLFRNGIAGVNDREAGVVPVSAELQQNFPNPFNPVTSIRYSVPATGQVSLMVFDALGRAVATLVNGTTAPGTYSAQFDASTLASGMYFARLQTGSTVQVRKMMLLK